MARAARVPGRKPSPARAYTLDLDAMERKVGERLGGERIVLTLESLNAKQLTRHRDPQNLLPPVRH